MTDRENTLLISNKTGLSRELSNHLSYTNGTSVVQAVDDMPPIGPYELPPAYSPTPLSGIRMISCSVCQSMISIVGKMHLTVVKCRECSEVTPIEAAQPGQKYIRCQCNCLLICKTSSQIVACPRPICKRIILLGQVATVVTRPPGSIRVTCVHCAATFLFDNALVRCPQCRKVLKVEYTIARDRAVLLLITSLIFLIGGIVVMAGTINRPNTFYTPIWISAFTLSVLFLVRSIFYFTMKVSHSEEL